MLHSSVIAIILNYLWDSSGATSQVEHIVRKLKPAHQLRRVREKRMNGASGQLSENENAILQWLVEEKEQIECEGGRTPKFVGCDNAAAYMHW